MNNLKIKAMRKQVEYCLNKKYDTERWGKDHPKEHEEKEISSTKLNL